MERGTPALVDKNQRERLERRFGSGARQWVASLPGLAERVATAWELELTGDSTPGRTSVVLGCRRSDGATGKLKISPDPGLIVTEARYLALWQGTGRVPEVWAVDADRGALLMEAIEPGYTVASRETVPEMRRVADLLRGLHAAEIDDHTRRELRPLDIWVNFHFEQWESHRAKGPAADLVPASMLHRGHAQARCLVSENDNDVLLHGDLHPGNVMEGGESRGLVAVDPRACVGDPAFDAVDWLVWRAESVTEVERRATILAPALDTGTDWLWRVVHAVAPLYAVARITLGGSTQAEIDTLLTLADA